MGSEWPGWAYGCTAALRRDRSGCGKDRYCCGWYANRCEEDEQLY